MWIPNDAALVTKNGTAVVAIPFAKLSGFVVDRSGGYSSAARMMTPLMAVSTTVIPITHQK